MKALLRNRPFWIFILLYAVSLVFLIATGKPVEDVIASLLILGIVLPLIALAACWRLPEPTASSPSRPGESGMLIGLLIFIALFLAVKGSILHFVVRGNSDPRWEETANTILKLVGFVIVPALILRWYQGRWPSAGKPTASNAKLWLVFLVLSAAVITVQLLIGSQVKRLMHANNSMQTLILGLLICFVWMTVEAGVVEEFFFRWLLQSRIAAITGSQISGVFLMALAFGLAHAPGILLRGAGVSEGLGEKPSLLTTLAYTITTQGVAGLMFGVVWARTRSFPLVVFLHAVVDTPANAARLIDLWHL